MTRLRPVLLALLTILISVLGSSSVVHARPWTVIYAPDPASGTVKVTARASVRSLARLEIYLGAARIASCSTRRCTYHWDTRKSTNGRHTLVAMRHDTSGSVTSSAPVSVTVGNDAPPPPDSAPPTVSVTAPATASGTATLSVSATDGSAVAQTRLYIDGTVVATAPGGRLIYGWDTTSVANGTHSVQGSATDPAGNSGTSQTVNVRVSNASAPPPPPSPPPPSGGVPLAYNAPTDRQVRPEPPLPAMGPRGSIVHDDISGARILRVTDGALAPERPGRSWTANDGSAEALMWNADGGRFLVYSPGGGELVPFAFDKVGFQATKMATPGGLWYIPVSSAVWDPTDPDLLYGGGGLGLQRYNVVSQALATVWDTSSLGASPRSLSIGNNGRIAGYIGGQDTATKAVARELGSGRTWVLDTQAGTLNGVPLASFAPFTIHNTRMGQDGRYVVISVSGGGAGSLAVWDLDGGTVTWCAMRCGGHKVQAHGYLLNNDNLPGGTYLAYQVLQRAVGALATAAEIIPDFPTSTGGTDSHYSWGNAQPTVLAPVVGSSSGEGLGTGPVQNVWDREIIAIATDGSGTVWRLAHHRSLYQSFYDGPHATISRDGRYVLFGSNWGQTLGTGEGVTRVDAFVLELPF